MGNRIFIFGESTKGQFCSPLYVFSLLDLVNSVGEPTSQSRGVEIAVQSLLFDHELLFFRVKEEGFSLDDYQHGVKLLYKEAIKWEIDAICIPGVGDKQIIDPLIPICKKSNSLLILSEQDLYDYLTVSKY